MQPIQMPPPYGGMNQSIPPIALQDPQCQSLYNFNTGDFGVSLRNGDSKYNKGTKASAQLSNRATAAYGEDNLFHCTYDATADQLDFWSCDKAVSNPAAIAYTPGVLTDAVVTPFYFNKYLFFFTLGGAHGPGYYYNGAGWNTIGYTYGGSPLPAPSGGVASYKNRLYIPQFASTGYYYTGRDAISGACNLVDLGSVFTNKSFIAVIARITVADSVEARELLAFISFDGQVVFYSGAYPDSADWGIVGRAQLGFPFSYGAGNYYLGDYIVMTDGGAVSLRDLFLKGSQNAKSIDLTYPIERSWRQLTAAMKAGYEKPSLSAPKISLVYDAYTSRLIFAFPKYVDPQGNTGDGTFFFIYDTNLQAWGFHRSLGPQNFFPNSNVVFYKNKTLFPIATGGTTFLMYEKEGASNFTDRQYDDAADVGYEFEIVSAPVGTQKTGTVYKFGGMDLIIKSDLYAQVSYQFVSDFGVITTTAQKIPAQASTLQRTFANIGIEGSIVQYKISGVTTTGKTVGYQLYATSPWVELGRSPR